MTGFLLDLALKKKIKCKKIGQFSGGEQTKLAFIKLLLSKPDILLSGRTNKPPGYSISRVAGRVS